MKMKLQKKKTVRLTIFLERKKNKANNPFICFNWSLPVLYIRTFFICYLSVLFEPS